MMKPLIDVMFASEKRKNVLLLLQDGTKEMAVILETLNTTRQALLPQMKVLEEHYLVSHDRDTYELTTIGKLVVNEISPFVDTLNVFDVDIDYWGTRSLDFIPSHLLRRIDELGKCTTITPTLANIYGAHDKFYERSKTCTFHSVITRTFYPHFPKILYELIPHNIHANVIVSSELFDQLRIEHRVKLLNFVENEQIHLFVYLEKMGLLSFICNDHCIMLSPLTNRGTFDNQHIECCNQGALNWGKELFEHYLKKSKPITKL
jgi:predicted transcriptional regulator